MYSIPCADYHTTGRSLKEDLEEISTEYERVSQAFTRLRIPLVYTTHQSTPLEFNYFLFPFHFHFYLYFFLFCVNSAAKQIKQAEKLFYELKR